MGFGGAANAADETGQHRIRDDVMGELKKTFRPEFLNRVDDIIVFRQLTKEDIHEIARRMLTISGQTAEGYGYHRAGNRCSSGGHCRRGF